MEKTGVFSFRVSKKMIAIAASVFLCLATGWGMASAPNVILLVLGSIFLLWLVSDLSRGLLLGIIGVNLSGFMFEIGITKFGVTLRPAQIVFAALLLVWIISLIVKNVRFHRTPLDIPIIGYLLINFISSLLKSADKMMSIQQCVLLTVYALMYFMTVNILIEYPDKVKKVVKFFIALGVIHCLYGILGQTNYAITGTPNVWLRGSWGAIGFFQEPNLFGIYVTVIAMLLISYSLSPFKHELRISTATMVVILAMILGATRSSWLAFPIGIAAILISSRKPMKPKYLARMVQVVFLFAVFFVMFRSFGPYCILDFSKKFAIFQAKISGVLDLSSSSATGRISTYKTAIENWQNSKLIGYGTGSRGWQFSSFIQTLNDAGIVGLFFMFWIHISPIIFGYKMLGKTKDSFVRYSLMGFIGGYAVLLITGQVSNFLWLGFPWVFWGIGMAMAMKAKQGNALEVENKR